MPDTLLQRIWFGCRHQFSWPRRLEEGAYYQVCLKCGIKYKYDWNVMRRTARVNENEPRTGAIGHKSARESGGRRGWHPRERRLRMQVPVQFRQKACPGEWRDAQSENISRSGLLFTIQGALPAMGSNIELIFLMPAEICGMSAAEVLCQAQVVRLFEASRHKPATVAARIIDYVYLPSPKAG